MGLNLTSTKPFLMSVSSLMQMGKVPSAACLRTFGLLGAESSFSTVHLASPLPVTALVQPMGGFPASASSKLIVAASAALASSALVSSDVISFVIGLSELLFFLIVRSIIIGHRREFNQSVELLQAEIAGTTTVSFLI